MRTRHESRVGFLYQINMFDTTSAEQRQALLVAIVAFSDDAIISKTLGGIITIWNPDAERAFGYAETETISQHISIIIPPDRLHEEEYITSQVSAGKRVEHFETIRYAKDGRQGGISVTISPVIDLHGRIIGASKIARDISTHRQLVKRLEDSEQRSRAPGPAFYRLTTVS